MRCVECGGVTKVTDSRDDRHPRNTWLVRYGTRVFGWWSSDFRLRKRACRACGVRTTTIEVGLDDLEDSLDDLRCRALGATRGQTRVPLDALRAGSLSRTQMDYALAELVARREADESIRLDQSL